MPGAVAYGAGWAAALGWHTRANGGPAYATLTPTYGGEECPADGASPKSTPAVRYPAYVAGRMCHSWW